MGIVDITSVRLFVFDFHYILLFKKTGLVFIFSVLCPNILTRYRSYWQLVSHVIFQSQTDRTQISSTLCLLILSFQQLSRSESSNERTQIKKGSDVWNYLSWSCYLYFNKLMLVLAVGVTRKISDTHIFCSKLSLHCDYFYYIVNGCREVNLQRKWHKSKLSLMLENFQSLLCLWSLRCFCSLGWLLYIMCY